MNLSLPPALAYEWRRSIATRSTLWLLALIVTFGLLASLNNLMNGTPGLLVLGAASHVSLGGPLAAAIGATAIGSEFRWNTARTLFTTFPRRYDILVAKVLVVGGLVAVASLVSSLLGAAVATFARDVSGSLLDWLDLSVRATLVVVAWAVIGFALGALAKNTAFGVLVPIAAATLGEMILIQLIRSETVASLMPFLNASAAVSVQVGSVQAYEHFAIFAAWVLLCLAAGVLVVGRRDV